MPLNFLKGVSLSVLSALSFAVMALIIKEKLSTVDAPTLVTYRGCIALLFLLPYFFVTGKISKIRPNTYIFGRAVFGALSIGCFFLL